MLLDFCHASFKSITSLLWIFIMAMYADISVDVPDFLDLNRLRATGLQPGEEELPDLTPPIVIPEDTRGENVMHECILMC